MHFNEAYDPFRALKSSWKVLRTAPASVLVGGLLLWVCDEGHALVSFDDRVDRAVGVDSTDLDALRDTAGELAREFFTGFASGLGAFLCVLSLAAFLFGSLIRLGFAAAVERALVQGTDELGDLFQARGRWSSMVLVRLLYGLAILGVMLPGAAFAGLAAVGAMVATETPEFAAVSAVLALVAYLPIACYVVLGVSLAPYAVAVEGLAPVEAMSRSWGLVRGHRWTLFLYYVVISITGTLLTFCTCCLFFFGSSVVSETCNVEAYLRLVKSGEPDTWWNKPSDTSASA